MRLRHFVGFVLLAIVATLVPVQHVTAAALPRVDKKLTEQLRRANSNDPIRLFVHARDGWTARSSLKRAGLRLFDSFDRIGVAVGIGTPGQISTLERDATVTYLEADVPIRYFTDTSHEATRGEELYRGFTVQTQEEEPPITDDHDVRADGAGVSIAIVDSGADGTHPMFQVDGQSKVVRNLKLACVETIAVTIVNVFAPVELGLPPCPITNALGIDPWVDVASVNNDTDTASLGGHGTHVAGIAAGVDVTTSDGRALHGAAPGAKLVVLSVGESESIYGAIAAHDWILEHHAAPCGSPSAACPPIRVVNNSFGPISGGEFDPQGAETLIQDALVNDGVTMVWAAGNGDAVNDGGTGDDNRVNPPAQDPLPGIIGVANYDDKNEGDRDNELDSSSSRGDKNRPETWPDISAPGTSITSACRPYLTICQGGDAADPDYNTTSGTSMAAPHIAGIVAQLLQLKPTLTPAELEDVIEDTAHQFVFGAPYQADPRNTDSTSSFDKGHGLVDAAAAAARVLGFTAPAVVTSCTPLGPVVVDPSGDATGFIGVGTPTDSEPTLDIREGRISWDATAGDVTFTIEVEDLTDEDPIGTQGIFFDYNFTYQDVGYNIVAERESGAESFALESLGATGREGVASGLEGSFDADSDTITIHLKNSNLEGTTVPPFEDGAALKNFSIVSRRDFGGVFVPDADTGAGVCPYTLGLGAVPPTEPPPPPPPPSADATFDAPGDTYSWSGESTTNIDFLFGCDGVSGPACDSRRIDVTTPGTLHIDLTGVTGIGGTPDPVGLYDYDLYLIAPDGHQIDQSENGGSVESITHAITEPGVYTIVVKAFLTVESIYNATATLS